MGGICSYFQDRYIENTLENIRNSGNTIKDTEGVEIDEGVIRHTLLMMYNNLPYEYYEGLRCQPYMIYQYTPQ